MHIYIHTYIQATMYTHTHLLSYAKFLICVCVCIYINTYIQATMYTHTHLLSYARFPIVNLLFGKLYVCMYAWYVCMYACTYTYFECMYVYTHLPSVIREISDCRSSIWKALCMYVCMVCMYVCMYVYVFRVYVRIHTHTFCHTRDFRL